LNGPAPPGSIQAPAQAWQQRPLHTDLLLACGLYALLAYLAIHLARQPGSIATLWMANGLAIGLIASAAPRRMPALLLAVAGGNLAANLAYGDPLPVSLAFLLPNTVEVAIGSWLLMQRGRAGRLVQDAPGLLQVVAWGAVLPPLAGATVGAALLQALGFASFERVWFDWYIGDVLGTAAMLPLVLALRAMPTPLRGQMPLPTALLALAAVAATTALSLHTMPHPLVVIGAALTGVAFVLPRVVTFACAPVVVATVGVSLALGDFQPRTGDTPLGHALLYLSVLALVLPAQLLAVVVARQRALADMLAAVGSRDDDIIVITDRNGVYRWVNRARERYHGKPASEVLGRTVSELAEGRHDRDQLVGAFQAALEGRTVRDVAEVQYAAMGTRTMDLRVQPAYDAEGQLTGVLFSAGDITEIEASRRELQRLTEELRASNRDLEQFVRIASHDLREPLNTVIQFSQLLEQGPAQQLDPSARLYLEQVRGGAARMKRMLDDLLQYVRLEGAPAAAPEPVPLDLVFEEVGASLQAQLLASGGTLAQQGTLGTVPGQPALLTLALQNLVSNALKFVAPGQAPEVTVRSQAQAGELHLVVADRGIGIDPARIGELGTPFKRLHARRKYDGTGLGLAIVKRVAELHGGRLVIESAPGEGSRFTLVLPLPA
jgi:PAS domain S-box-containing protein